MDNVNTQGVTNDESSTRHFGERGTKKGFTFKKAIKYVVIVVAIIIIYKVFFAAASSIDTVKNNAFMNSYGNATTSTFGEYFVDGTIQTGETDFIMSDVRWSSARNDMGTGDIVTMTYSKSVADYDYDPNKDYTSDNCSVVIKWFVSDEDGSTQCVYLSKDYSDWIYSYDCSGDEAQEKLYDMLKSGYI